MSIRHFSRRSALALLVLLTLTFAAVANWTEQFPAVPFLESVTSASAASARSDAVVEPRRVDGRRIDLGRELLMLAPLDNDARTPNTAVLTITDNDSSNLITPAITYTPIPANSFNPTLAATITDPVGVTGATIFWRINGGSFTSAACSFASGTPQSGTWSCMITGMSALNSVSYYVTANDAALNTVTNPSGGAAAPNLFTFGPATIPAGAFTNMSVGNLVLLGGNVVISSSLTLNGIVNTGPNTLNLECGVQLFGGGALSYVVGSLGRFFCGVETFTYVVGGPVSAPISEQGNETDPEGVIVSNYSPVTVTITGGTVGSSLKVSVFDTALAGFDPARSLSRNWSIEESGNLTANIAFTYRDEDVNGNEADYRVYRYPGDGAIVNLCLGAPCVNTATNTVTVSNVSAFSRWTAAELLSPTAASVSVSGRVLDAFGRPIRNAIVTLEGGHLDQPQQLATGQFGYYGFPDLAIGSYTITVRAQRDTFANPVRSISLVDDVKGFDFVAEPRQ